MSETQDEFSFEVTGGRADPTEILSSDAGGGILGGVQPGSDDDGVTDVGESVVGIDTDLNDGPSRPGNV